MQAIFKDVETYLLNNKPENIKISEKEITFFAGSFDFVIKPRYSGDSEYPFFEVEIKQI